MNNKPAHKIFSKAQGYLITVFLISVLMTAVMSLGMLVIKLNTFNNITQLWLKDFLTGCLIAIPAGFVLVPVIQKIADHFTDEEIHPGKKLKLKR